MPRSEKRMFDSFPNLEPEAVGAPIVARVYLILH